MTVAIVFLAGMLLASGLVVAMGFALARKREAQEALVEKCKRVGGVA
ncbi:hypothetical protein PS627_00069 [Pseudomonas fluorescens]|nr:hypothetical protein [Pseudomonas fluorescens]CAG8863133.1 hypothetical protein PS627_00069 [Pseudomonas fluorescens]